MNSEQLRILLADDDLDDCFLFKEALDELLLYVRLSIVNDGEHLMTHLNKESTLPHILFLDMNMPRKNGLECLDEIKCCEKLKSIPVIIFSTSMDQGNIASTFQKGAQHYIQKPREFAKLKKAVHQVISLTKDGVFIQPTQEKFVLSNF